MIPSLGVFGGMRGLLGLAESAPPPAMTVLDLSRSVQRQVDSYPIEYAALLQEASGKAKDPIAKNAAGNRASVALVGGGIANIVAAYELSRVGLAVTLFEREKRIGGRLYSFTFDEASSTSKQWSELGGMRFPAGGLMWHYVAEWCRFNQERTGNANLDPAKITLEPFPNPGLKPTLITYQGTSAELTDDLGHLPEVFREAKQLFASYFGSLHDDSLEPHTVYFGTVQDLLRLPELTGADADQIHSFWTAMIRRYDGRSFGDVLQTEVFAASSSVPDLLAAFGTLGLGTGGFGPLYEVGFLELLRLLLWDFSGEYNLPAQADYPQLFPAGEGGSQGFAAGLAQLAFHEAETFEPGRVYDEMFRTDTAVTKIEVSTDASKPGVYVTGAGLEPELFDYAIVGMSSRAMQALGLDLNYPGGPLAPDPQGPPESNDIKMSTQAAIRRLGMMSAYKMFARVPVPSKAQDWPKNSEGKPYANFLTDERARATYVLPPVDPTAKMTSALVSYAWGSDAVKFDPLTVADRQSALSQSYAYGLVGGHTGDAPTKPLADAIRASASVRDVDWNTERQSNGGFKLDRPEDNYFSDSLFYHYSSAVQGGSRVFFAGDSASHLGGWIEGAAMSAVNASIAVCFMVGMADRQLQLRKDCAAVLAEEAVPFHRWKSLDGDVPGPSGVHLMRRDVDLVDSSGAAPPDWRYSQHLWRQPVLAMSAAQSGEHVLFVDENERLLSTQGYLGRDWSLPAVVPGTTAFKPTCLSVASPRRRADSRPSVVSVMFVSEGTMHHGLCVYGTWTAFGVPWPDKVKRVALDVVGGDTQVIAVDANDELRYGFRYDDGHWTDFGRPQGPTSPTFKVLDAAVSCSGGGADATTFAVISLQSSHVYWVQRTRGVWGDWQDLHNPLVGSVGLVPRRIAVLSQDDTGFRKQMVALFSDGNLWSTSMKVEPPPLPPEPWTPWRKLPYPLSESAGTVGDIGLSERWDVPTGSLSSMVVAQVTAPSEAFGLQSGA
jgi:monoamine oxidase